MVDPVRLFLSLSLKTVFHRKPPPITIWAVADINIDVCKWVVRTEATTHHLSGSGLREEKPKKHVCFWRENSAWEHVLFVYTMFSVFVNKLIDRNKVFKL